MRRSRGETESGPWPVVQRLPACAGTDPIELADDRVDRCTERPQPVDHEAAQPGLLSVLEGSSQALCLSKANQAQSMRGPGPWQERLFVPPNHRDRCQTDVASNDAPAGSRPTDQATGRNPSARKSAASSSCSAGDTAATVLASSVPSVDQAVEYRRSG